MVSPGQLASLRDKAGTRSFTLAELLAVEPLVALAEQDEVERGKKLVHVQKRSRSRSASAQAQLDHLVRATTQRRSKRGTERKPVVQPSVESKLGSANVEDAEPTASPHARRDPASAAGLAKQGHVALRAGRTGEAGRLFERALEADPRNAMALMGLSTVYFETGHYARAASYAERAVQRSPERARYRIALGDAYYKSFRYDDAKAQYTRAEALGDKRASGRLTKVDEKLQ
jgi:tetratricopeptide (TPR) repeat protein